RIGKGPDHFPQMMCSPTLIRKKKQKQEPIQGGVGCAVLAPVGLDDQQQTRNKLKYARLDSRSIAQGAAARGLIVVAGRLIKSHK
ncbi:hypothetical protein, partial [Xenorhabdus bovienii]|uniref:hypothetical protein n=1 Tax=Xenorhabdus bovienii TaxID=40576 RepID=UPI0023B31787